nr:amidohydrolase [Scopulibacillus darangshiensis]
MSLTNLLAETDKIKCQVIDWRRHFHMHPELSFQEKKTSAFIYQTLLSFENLEVTRPTEYSVMARLIGESPGKVLAMRADIDALPIMEENDFDFVSQSPGVMHACGHDGHTAMMLGAAKILSENKDDIKGEIRFLFQHAEEQFPGGAKEMVEAGVLDGVDYIIGLHLFSTIPKGEIGVIYGPLTANDDTFELKIIGKGGHASAPDTSIDPIAIASQFVSNLQHIVSRKLDPLERLVISVTEFHAGNAVNIIPESATLSGSVRSFSQDVRGSAVQLIEQIAKGVTSAHGASYQFNYDYGYSSVVNNDLLTKKVEDAVSEIFGDKCIRYGPPMMGGEDFSAFLKKIPGCFIPVGARNETKGIVHPHHHPKFTIDEDALNDGVKILINASLKILD